MLVIFVLFFVFDLVTIETHSRIYQKWACIFPIFLATLSYIVFRMAQSEPSSGVE